MDKTYTVNIQGLARTLPILRLTPELSIASFVILGDCEVVVHCAPLIVKRLPPVDVLITAEAKGIPLVHEIARLMGHPRYLVARKSVKPYMDAPLVDEVESITTQKKQTLCLDGHDAACVRGKRVAIIDDVISTGESISAVERLVEKAGGVVAARAAILAEGDACKRTDIIFLQELPLFP